MVNDEILKKLKVMIYADGADQKSILSLSKNTVIKGFTTNPSLMKKNGITNYKKFALEISKELKDKPISFEVFADDIKEMRKQAYEISTWGENINVKIPITNTKGEMTSDLIEELSSKKIVCNITAILTITQFEEVVKVLHPEVPAILSVFAGRIADTGKDPSPIMKSVVELARQKPLAQVLWASTREIFNIFQAEQAGCHIITVPHDLIKKFEFLGKDLKLLSLETVKTFYADAQAAGFKIDLNEK